MYALKNRLIETVLFCLRNMKISFQLSLLSGGLNRPCLTEGLLMGCKESDQTKQNKQKPGVFSKVVIILLMTRELVALL